MNRLFGLHRLAMLSVFFALFTLPGCCHNLQRPFVESMDETVKSIEKDIEHGLYKPDALSVETLTKAKKAVEDAKAVLASDGDEEKPSE